MKKIRLKKILIIIIIVFNFWLHESLLLHMGFLQMQQAGTTLLCGQQVLYAWASLIVNRF